MSSDLSFCFIILIYRGLYNPSFDALVFFGGIFTKK